jgi:hypothetical protein
VFAAGTTDPIDGRRAPVTHCIDAIMDRHAD